MMCAQGQHSFISNISLLFLILLLLVALVPAASAERIVNQKMEEFIDTSRNGSISISGAIYDPGSVTNLRFWNIAELETLNYIVLSFSGSQYASREEGIYELTYYITTTNNQDIPGVKGSSNPGTGRVYVAHSRNVLGQVTGTKFTYFFDDWYVAAASGQAVVHTNYSLGTCQYTSSIGPSADSPLLVAKGLNPAGGYSYGYIISSHHYWQNTIIVDANPDETCTVQLIREGYNSTMNVYRNGALWHTNTDLVNHTVIVPPVMNNVSIISPRGTLYVFNGPSPPSTAPVTIYIRDAATGNLIPGARLSILDGVTGTEIVNETLSTGQESYNLNKASTLRYSATATATNYTSFGTTQFGVGDDPISLVIWMYPAEPGIEDPDEGKTALYGYVITQGNQQPIPGATVSLSGVGSTTTSSTGFYLFNNIYSGTYTISASATSHDTLSEQVTVEESPTQHNLALKGHYLLTVTIKDADTLANVRNATISLSDGQETTQNPYTFSIDYGPYTITAGADGYYPQSQVVYADKPGTTTATILLTPKTPLPPAPEYPNYPPHNVRFTVQTLFGAPIPGVTVTAQGIQQTPSPNILERLLGINTTTTPINTELMSGTTDSNGDINFMMIEAVKYRVTFFKPDVVNKTIEIYPKEDHYPIILTTTGGPLLPEAGDPLKTINISVTTSTSDDTGHITVVYNDTTFKTTSLSILVAQQTGPGTTEEIATFTENNDANVTHTFDLSDYKGNSYFVHIEATHPDYGTVVRDFAVWFKAPRVPLGNLPDELYVYVAGFLLLLVGGIFTASSATKGVIVVAFSGWLFYAFGWLDSLGSTAPLTLSLVSVFAVIGVILSRYREEGYT